MNGGLITLINSLNIWSFSKHCKIFGVLPSTKVIIAIIFSPISFPKRSKILLKMYFWVADNLSSLDFPTKQTAWILSIWVLKVSSNFFVVSLSNTIPLVSPNQYQQFLKVDFYLRL